MKCVVLILLALYIFQSECINTDCTNTYIKYVYFNRNVSNVSISALNTNASSKVFLHGVETYIIIHGFNDDIYSTLSPGQLLLKPLLQYADANIVLCDWSKYAPLPFYTEAMQNVPLVANCTARLLETLVHGLHISVKTVHVIGHSLGAHIAGSIEQFTKIIVHHIVGMDPPFFLYTPLSRYRLRILSADTVQTFHTNSAVLGEYRPSGDVDFYYEDGTDQLPCQTLGINLPARITCSHLITSIFYAESINSPVGFYGCPLTMKTEFCLAVHAEVPAGFHTPLSTTGLYEVKTAIAPPYALGNTTVFSQVLHNIDNYIEKLLK